MMNSVSLTSVLASTFANQAASVETGIATINKSNEIAQQEGNALVQMLEDSLAQVSTHILDTYA